MSAEQTPGGFKCKQMEHLPVISDGQLEVKCPKCSHFHKGQCVNPNRHNEADPCPFDGKELPTTTVTDKSV